MTDEEYQEWVRLRYLREYDAWEEIRFNNLDAIRRKYGRKE